MFRGYWAVSHKGFTLIGLLVIVAVMAIMGAVAVPSIFRSVRLSHEKATKEQLEEIQKAIMGDLKLGTYGYVGDMGRFPNTLSELNTQGTQPSWTTTGNYLTVGMGWRGPYLNEFFPNAYLKDAWGTDYVLTVTTYPGVDSTTARVQSCGPDLLPNTDDDYFSDVMILKGNVRLKVTIGMSDNIPKAVDTDLYYSNNGTQCSTPLHGDIITLPGERGFWSYVGIGPVHHGVHGMMVHVGAIEEVVIVSVVGGIMNDVEVGIPVGPARGK